MIGDDEMTYAHVYFTEMAVNHCNVIQNVPKVGYATVIR